VVVVNLVIPKDPHIVDPTLQANCHPQLNPAGCGNNLDINTDILELDYRPFTADFTTLQDEVDPADQTAPADIDCLITLPCKMQYDFSVAGGSPLAVPILGIKHDDSSTGPVEGFTYTRPTEYSKVAKVTAVSTIDPGGLACFVTFGVAGLDMINAAIPLGVNDLPGQLADDTPTAKQALFEVDTWSTKLQSWVNVVDKGVDGVLDGSPALVGREQGDINVAGTDVAINILIFDQDTGNPTDQWFKVSVVSSSNETSHGASAGGIFWRSFVKISWLSCQESLLFELIAKLPCR